MAAGGVGPHWDDPSESIRKRGIEVGHKAAHLEQLVEILKVLEPSDALDFAIPPFLALPDREMKSVLLQVCPGFSDKWEEFCASFDPEHPQLDEEGIAILHSIQDDIEKGIEDDTLLLPDTIDAFLKSHNPEYLIVRSTGKEDTDELSNAGGNLSIPFVKTEPFPIKKAVLQVMSSYFSPSSIRNRLSSHDRSLFTEKPIVPVLLQVMVKEPDGDPSAVDPRSKLKSGVLFTGEEGGVTHIEVAEGNNEYVVSAYGPTEKHFIFEGKDLCHVKVTQKERFVLADGVARPVPSSSSSSEPILSKSQAEAISQVTEHISRVFGKKKMKAMDFEFSIAYDPEKDRHVCYLLQARPIVAAPPSESPPTYLKGAVLKSRKDASIHVETFLPGSNAVTKITDPSQVLIAETLDDALDQYNRLDDKKGISLIISKKGDSLLSHPAVNLRARGLPLLLPSKGNFEDIRRSLSECSEEHPLLCDVQNEVLLVNTPLVEDDCIQGLKAYPMPARASLQSGPPKTKEAVLSMKRKVDHFMRPRLGARPYQDKTLYDLLDTLRSSSEEYAEPALTEMILRLEQLYVKYRKGASSSEKETLDRLYVNTMDLLTGPVAKSVATHEIGSYERLFPLRILEAFLFQDEDPELPDTTSIKAALHAHKVFQKLKEKGSTHRKDIRRGGGEAPGGGGPIRDRDEVQVYTGYLLKVIEKLPQKKQQHSLQTVCEHFIQKEDSEKLKQFCAVVALYEKYSCCTEWVVERVTPLLEEEPDLDRVFRHIEKAAERDTLIFQRTESTRKKLRTLSGKAAALESEETATSEKMEEIMQEYRALFATVEKTFHTLERDDTLSKIIVLQQTEDIIEALDATMKAVTGSTKFPTEVSRARIFFPLLQKYVATMNYVASICLFLDQAVAGAYTARKAASFNKSMWSVEFRGGARRRRDASSERFDSFERKLLSGTLPEEEARKAFQVPERFCVPLSLKSEYAFFDSMEVVFTLTHQKALAALGELRTNMIAPDVLLSEKENELVRAYIDGLLSSRHILGKVRLHISNIEFLESGEKRVTIRMPLRSHYVMHKITFSETPHISLEFFGDDEANRWFRHCFYAEALTEVAPWLTLTESTFTEKQATTTFSLRTGDDEKLSMSDLGAVILGIFINAANFGRGGEFSLEDKEKTESAIRTIDSLGQMVLPEHVKPLGKMITEKVREKRDAATK